MNTSSVLIRTPSSKDGYAVNQLISRIPELDSNSCYCNLLQCSHFAETSILAESQGELVGFISGYHKPNAPNTLFVWQVAISPEARGCGLASEMLQQLLGLKSNQSVTHIETTITADNKPSWGLFSSLARRTNTALEKTPFFDRVVHFSDQHDSEFLVRIGPFHH